MAEVEIVDGLLDLQHVGRSSADDDEMDIFRQRGHGFHSLQHIFAGLDGANIQDIFVGQGQAPLYIIQLLLRDGLAEGLVASLINDLNLAFVGMEVMDDIPLGTLADGYDMVGYVAGAMHLVFI